MPHQVTLIPGDGIGPEVSAATRRVIEATCVKIDWEVTELNPEIIAKTGQSVPQYVIDSLERTDVGLKAPVTTPIAGGYTSVNVALRKRLDLYANVRPARTRPFLESNMKPGKSMDLVIMREATEGFYPDRNMTRGWGEVMPSPDMALSTRKITRHCSDRIARRAFELAAKRRKRVTAIHKANSFHMTDGLFLECCRIVAREFPQVQYDEMLVDASTAQIQRRDQARGHEFAEVRNGPLRTEIDKIIVPEMIITATEGGRLLGQDFDKAAEDTRGFSQTILLPIMFRDHGPELLGIVTVEVIVEGRIGRDGVFRATEVLAKCGSRYDAAYDKTKKA